MKDAPYWLRFPWIAVNIALFSGYAVFDAASFFWPRAVFSFWILAMYIATVSVNCLIVYGLVRRIAGIRYLVVLVSFLLVVHLLIFIFHPLGLSLAYLGPSRAFYSLFISLLSRLTDEKTVGRALAVFNISMACVHVFNILYFTGKKAASLFQQS